MTKHYVDLTTVIVVAGANGNLGKLVCDALLSRAREWKGKAFSFAAWCVKAVLTATVSVA